MNQTNALYCMFIHEPRGNFIFVLSVLLPDCAYAAYTIESVPQKIESGELFFYQQY